MLGAHLFGLLKASQAQLELATSRQVVVPSVSTSRQIVAWQASGWVAVM
jgi:hypothetical protein